MGAIYGHGGHLDLCTITIFTNFQSPFNTRLHMKLKKFGPGVSEEKSFKGVNGWTDGWRTGSDQNSSGELKNINVFWFKSPVWCHGMSFPICCIWHMRNVVFSNNMLWIFYLEICFRKQTITCHPHKISVCSYRKSNKRPINLYHSLDKFSKWQINDIFCFK